MLKNQILKYIFATIICLILWNIIIETCIIKSARSDTRLEFGRSMQPNADIINNKEGFTKYKTDAYGFNNNRVPTSSDKVILIVGDSHAEAQQVERNVNFSSIAGSFMDGYFVYNIGISGNNIPDILYYAQAYKKQFHPVKVVITVTAHNFTIIEKNETNRHYIKEENGLFLLAIDPDNSMLNFINQYFYLVRPVESMLMESLSNAKNIFKELKSPQNTPFFPSANAKQIKKENIDYSKVIDWQINKIKEDFGDNVVLLFLPQTPIINPKDGKVIFFDEEENNIKLLIMKSCVKYNLDIIDMKSEFDKLLVEKKKFPRGFDNTLPDTGHLNNDGHNIVGLKLAEYLKREK